MNTQYADGIKNIFINNGVVHFELATVILNDKNEPIPQFSGSLVMSLNGLVNMHDQVNAIVKKMLADGILKPNDTENNQS
jgi:hypothetical protein